MLWVAHPENNAVRKSFFSFALIGLGLILGACAREKKVKPPPVRAQTPAEEVLRIGRNWNSSVIEKGILSKPSPVSFFRNRRTSELRLSETQADENLEIFEELELRGGKRIQCQSIFRTHLALRWFRRDGEAALEATRPAFKLKRNCSQPHQLAALEEPAHRALLVLRGDQLVAVEPKVDDRVYIPMD